MPYWVAASLGGVPVRAWDLRALAVDAAWDGSLLDGRRYRYLLKSSPVRSPILQGRVGWTHLKLDPKKMQQAALLLEGEHDFSSFRAAECQAKSPIKTLYSAKISGTPQLLKLDLHGNAFLHHMVCNIMGALVYVGSGRLSVSEFQALIEERSQLKAPPTFMPDYEIGRARVGKECRSRWSPYH